MSAPINILRNMLIPDTTIYHTPDCFLNTHGYFCHFGAPQQLLLECYNVLLHRHNANIDMENSGCHGSRPVVLIAPCWHLWIAIAAASWACRCRGWATGPGGLSWRKCLVLRVWVFFLRKCEGEWGVNFGMSDFFQLKIKLDVDITVESFSQAVNSLDCGLLYHR